MKFLHPDGAPEGMPWAGRQRMTDCCGAFATYFDDVLCCKTCYEEVEVGQGDGTSYLCEDGRTLLFAPVRYELELDGRENEDERVRLVQRDGPASIGEATSVEWVR